MTVPRGQSHAIDSNAWVWKISSRVRGPWCYPSLLEGFPWGDPQSKSFNSLSGYNSLGFRMSGASFGFLGKPDTLSKGRPKSSWGHPSLVRAPQLVKSKRFFNIRAYDVVKVVKLSEGRITPKSVRTSLAKRSPLKDLWDAMSWWNN